jgi:hypothetical protein
LTGLFLKGDISVSFITGHLHSTLATPSLSVQYHLPVHAGRTHQCSYLKRPLNASASPEALRGRYLAFFQFSWSIASILAPSLFTTLFTVSPTLPWLVTGLLMLLASFCIYRLEAHLPEQAVYRERQ